MYKIGFIGAGNMGSALAAAAARNIGGEQICVIDHNPEKEQRLANAFQIQIASSMEELTENSEYIVLAVKPGVMQQTARAIAPVLKETVPANESSLKSAARNSRKPASHVIVTIAAGVPIASIRQWTGSGCPILRLMPNTPVAIGKGTTLLTCSEDTPEQTVRNFLEIMKEAGSFERIAESKMDITSSINGCTPAYAYMFIEALADGAVQAGVPRSMALRLAAQTVSGAASMILETGKHPDQLKDEVCSPGGSTIVGVETLEAHGFRYAVAQSIVTSTEKNCSLGK